MHLRRADGEGQGSQEGEDRPRQGALAGMAAMAILGMSAHGDMVPGSEIDLLPRKTWGTGRGFPRTGPARVDV
jgi:hypothetical protein